MKSNIDCIPCFVRQALDACRLITDDESRICDILKQELAFLAAANLEVPPPRIVQQVHRIIRKELGDTDPYRHLKSRSIRTAVEYAVTAERLVDGSKEPFAASLRFAIAGNIIDFGKDTEWNDHKILESFTTALEQKVDEHMIGVLRDRLYTARTVLFLGDNAGETVFDRLFISRFPGNSEVFYAVKGGAVINDATTEDAIASGLQEVAKIVSNGTDIPGTMLEDTSPEFQALFAEADVVISKGQGNFETLNDAEREVFFLLQIKCASLARRNGFCQGDWVVAKTASTGKN